MVRPAEDISPMTEAPLTSRTIKFYSHKQKGGARWTMTSPTFKKLTCTKGGAD